MKQGIFFFSLAPQKIPHNSRPSSIIYYQFGAKCPRLAAPIFTKSVSPDNRL
jgi:hypothetical protein